MNNYLEYQAILQNGLKAYLDARGNGAKRSDIGGESGDWDSESYTRASSIASCPRKHAGERKGSIAKREYSLKKRLMFASGDRMAELVKEAVCYNVEHVETSPFLAADYEYRILDPDTRLAGTVDLVVYDGEQSYPVEIKRTNANEYGFGFTSKQIWQLIAYMELLCSDAGFLFCVFDPWDNSHPETHTVFLVEKTAEGWDVKDESGLKLDGGEFEMGKFKQMLIDHREWFDERYDNADAVAPYTNPVSFECGSGMIKSPEFYQKSGMAPSTGRTYKAGQLKPGTGVVYDACPLFSLCFHDKIERGEFEPDGNNYVFVSKDKSKIPDELEGLL